MKAGTPFLRKLLMLRKLYAAKTYEARRDLIARLWPGMTDDELLTSAVEFEPDEKTVCNLTKILEMRATPDELALLAKTGKDFKSASTRACLTHLAAESGVLGLLPYREGGEKWPKTTDQSGRKPWFKTGDTSTGKAI